MDPFLLDDTDEEDGLALYEDGIDDAALERMRLARERYKYTASRSVQELDLTFVCVY
jgi:hypothetical protein